MTLISVYPKEYKVSKDVSSELLPKVMFLSILLNNLSKLVFSFSSAPYVAFLSLLNSVLALNSFANCVDAVQSAFYMFQKMLNVPVKHYQPLHRKLDSLSIIFSVREAVESLIRRKLIGD